MLLRVETELTSPSSSLRLLFLLSFFYPGGVRPRPLDSSLELTEESDDEEVLSSSSSSPRFDSPVSPSTPSSEVFDPALLPVSLLFSFLSSFSFIFLSFLRRFSIFLRYKYLLTLLLDYGFSEVDLFRGELLVIFLLPVVDPIIRPIIHTAILWIGTNLMRVSLFHHVIFVVFVADIVIASDCITVVL